MGSILAIAVSEIIRFRKKASHEDVKIRTARRREQVALPVKAFNLTSGKAIGRVGLDWIRKSVFDR